ncbi:MAG: rhamnulokinase, partial [Bacilli bacterium]|nr:rhamnulokinase [Bacilli bacterium]
MKYYLAIDLGASSGRHVVGYEANGEIILEEVHRFPTGMDESPDGLVWDIPRLFQEIKIGIKKVFAKYPKIESLAIDTWGVDYVLMDGNQEIPPYYAYRNKRNALSAEEVGKTISFSRIYERTGIQFAPFNSIFQLSADRQDGRLDRATDYLMLPSYFTYKLTGVKTHEYTNESTGAILNPLER